MWQKSDKGGTFCQSLLTTMENIKENIANNICRLRKINGYSQSQLGEKLCYTDKTISKWERGESTPDVNSLFEMSKIFGVTVDYFFEDHSNEEIAFSTRKQVNERKVYSIFGLFIASIWLLAAVAFIYPYLVKKPVGGYWLSLIWALPLTFFSFGLFGIKRKIKYWAIVFYSLTLWTLILSIYLTLFYFNMPQMYMLFIVGIPLQAALIITYYLKQSKSLK